MNVSIEGNFVKVSCDSFQQTLEIEKPKDMKLWIGDCNFDFRDSLFIRFWCWLRGIKRNTIAIEIKENPPEYWTLNIAEKKETDIEATRQD
jgi:hypothetical protein